MKMPDASRRPPGRTEAASAGASSTSNEAMRLASTRSKGPHSRHSGVLTGTEPRIAPTRRDKRLRATFAVVESTAIGSVSTPSTERAPRRAAAMARMPEPQPTSSTRAPSTMPVVGPAIRCPPGTGGWWDGARCRRPCRVECQHHVTRLGAMTAPRRPDDQPLGDPQHREVLLPCGRPVFLVDRLHHQLPDGSEPERLEVSQVAGHLVDGRLRRRTVEGRDVRPERGAGSRLRGRRESLVDEREGHLHGDAARGHPRQDLD